MNSRGWYNESEMQQRTCKMVRVVRHASDGAAFASVNRDANGDRARFEPSPENPGMSITWDKCEGSRCAHWRWHRSLTGKATPGGYGYCGMAGKE